MPPPIAFSDSEIEELMVLAAPLPPSQRGAYLESVAAMLAQYPSDSRGPGTVHRLGRELQSRFLHERPDLLHVARSRR